MISIIVPVYNVGNYLEKCLESILQQDYTDFELLLIDDGSTDESAQICQNYARKDARIQLIRQENRGVSAARNAGLDIARGEWIGFVDSDDYLERDFYSRLLRGAEQYNADMACCGVCSVDMHGNKKILFHPASAPKSPIRLSREDALQNYFSPNRRYISWAPWNKIIRSSIAKKYRFEVGRTLAEDFYYVFECIGDCESILYDPTAAYYYLSRAGSATRQQNFTERSFDAVYFFKKAREELKKRGEKEETIDLANTVLILNTARCLRQYYKKRADASQNKTVSRQRKECGEILRTSCRIPQREASLKQNILLAMAKYAPQLFRYM